MKSASEMELHSSDSDRVLVIMAKAPRPGAVKTRLAPCLSPAALTDFYCCLLEDTLALARSLADVEVTIMCPDTDVIELTQLAGSKVSVVAQKGEGLAAGLTSVFAHFAEGHQRRTIAFNSDSPHLPRSVLEDAFETLATHDVVVGPTHDGGYYLVGAKAGHPTLFAGDGMGTSSALERLLSRARALELTVGFADPFWDIDVADDLTRLAEELRLAAVWHIEFLRLPAGADEDIRRYVWDGRLQRLGYNPYIVVPSDPAVKGLHTPETRNLNNPDLPSPYPAGAQLFFRAVTAIHESVFAFKVAFLICDFAIALVLLDMLRVGGRSPHVVLVYAWNPLLAIEVAGSGHIDIIGALLLVISVASLAHRWRATAALTLG